MKDYNLTELTTVIKNTFANYDRQGTEHWTWQDAAQDLVYQIGSLNKIILQLNDKRWAENKSQVELEAEFRDELADILAEVIYIAAERGIDMNQAVNEMLASDQKKVADRAA